MTRIFTVALFALLAASCDSATPASTRVIAPRVPASATTGPVSPASRDSDAIAGVESLAEFAKRIRVECQVHGHTLECIGGKPDNGDIYDVELRPDCGADGFFGGVASETGVELRDALPPRDETTPAILARGQLVCIQAVGRAGQDPSYFYVTAVPVADVPACRGNRLCAIYGDRSVTGWHGNAAACRIETSTRPSRACPQGWARREDIEDFSNGM